MVVMALCGACTVDERTVQLPEEPTQHAATYFDIPQAIQIGYDILVVVDSSPAMAPHADRVALQLGKLFSQLARFGDPDWHLGVVASDLGGPERSGGDDGVFRSDGLVGAPFLIEWRHLDNRHTANYEGGLADAFARLATVGTSGSARQQPLAAARRALEQQRNAGFRRDDANLIIVIVSAGDDASSGSVLEHVEALRELAPDRRVSVAGIYDGPAPRLDTVIAAFPSEGEVAPLSSDDLLDDLRLRIHTGGWWGVPCLEGNLGPTPECSISDVVFDHDVRVYESVLQGCDADQTNKPCWRIEKDLQNCPTWASQESSVLKIERRDYPPSDTHVIGNCVSR